jgi:16S rRNA (uracil1498-N3)-methyltransferase
MAGNFCHPAAVAHFFVYAPCEIIENQSIELDRSTAHHVLHVLRIGQRDRVSVFDGAGIVASCSIEVNGKSTLAIPAAPQKIEEPRIKIHLLQGITKEPAMDATVRTATELGVWEIYPIACAFASGGLRADGSSPRMDRWNAIALGACRQSHNPFVPTINHPMQLENIHLAPNSLRIAAGLGDGALPWKKFLKLRGGDLSKAPSAVYLAVGPEGDFSSGEWKFIRQSGFVEISLGPRVLTSETAAAALISAVQLAI